MKSRGRGQQRNPEEQWRGRLGRLREPTSKTPIQRLEGLYKTWRRKPCRDNLTLRWRSGNSWCRTQETLEEGCRYLNNPFIFIGL